MEVKSAMEVISIIGAKGGLGKSCLAVNMANYLSKCGIKTLLVDCDFNTNGSTNFMEMSGLEIKPTSPFKSLEVLLSRPVSGNEFEAELEKPEVCIQDYYFFVPTTLRETAGTFSQFKTEELNRQKAQLDLVFEQWREQYSVIILDHPGGYTDLANFLLSYTSKILLINTDNVSGIKTARSLYKKMAITNQDIVQCINKIDDEPGKESESLIKKCYGFKENNTYRDDFSRGVFIELDLKNMRVLAQILMELLPVFSYDISAIYEEKVKQLKRYKAAENQRKRLTREKHYRMVLGVHLFFSVLISFVCTRYSIDVGALSYFDSPISILLSVGIFIIVAAVILGSLFLLYLSIIDTAERGVLRDACRWYLKMIFPRRFKTGSWFDVTSIYEDDEDETSEKI